MGAQARFGGRAGGRSGVFATPRLYTKTQGSVVASRGFPTLVVNMPVQRYFLPPNSISRRFSFHTLVTRRPNLRPSTQDGTRPDKYGCNEALAAANVPATCPQPTRNAPSACRSGMNLNAAEFSDYTEQVLCRAVPCLSLLSPSVPRFVPTRHAPRCAAGGRGPLQHVQRVRSRRLRLHLARKSHVNHGGDCPPALEHGTWTFRPANRRADPAVAPCFARRSTWR